MEGKPFTDLVDHSFCEQTYPDPSILPAGIEPSSMHLFSSKDNIKNKQVNDFTTLYKLNTLLHKLHHIYYWVSHCMVSKHLVRFNCFTDTSVVEPVLKTKDLKKIKKIIRSNHWPPDHPIRKYLWQHLCRIHTTEHTSIYNETVNEVFGSGTTYSNYV